MTIEKKTQIMRQISSALADKRKSRHISLQTISQRLKIRESFLEAMETSRWDDLPGEVYLRGFLIRYAQYLGIDGHALTKPYLDVMSQMERDEPGQESYPVERNGVKTNWIWVGLIVVLFLGLIKFLIPEHERKGPSMEQHNVGELVGREGSLPVKISPTNGKINTIELFTPTPLWLRIKTETRQFEGFIPQESTWTWKSKGDFLIRIGHTKQVVMVFNGQNIALKENQRNVHLHNEN